MDEDSASTLQKQAITAALSYNWDAAVDLNKKLIKLYPQDTDCLNRLARAFFEQGKYPQAKKIYQEVLEIDPYNVIAQKNLKKLSSFKKGVIKNNHNNHAHLSPLLFLEEAGITKVISLVKLAEPKKLSMTSAGEEVLLQLKNRGICVTDAEGNYLGVLPDDASHLLMKLIRGGNKYQAIIKSVKQNSLSILIREVFRSKKFRNQPSFVADAKTSTYSTDHISILTDDDSSSDDESQESEDTA